MSGSLNLNTFLQENNINDQYHYWNFILKCENNFE